MEQRTDVVVIGGGAIGICVAHYLLQQKRSVVVVERGEVGKACSLGNAGLVVPSHFVPLAAPGVIGQGLRWMLDATSPFYIKPRPSLALISWLLAFRAHANADHVRRSMPLLRDLAVASRALYEDLAHNLDFGFSPNGLLMLYRTDKGKREAEELGSLSEQLGLASRLVDNAGATAVEPNAGIVAPGGIFFPDDAHIIPELFVPALAEHTRREGATILTSTEVLGFETSGETIAAVRTSTGPLAADQFVLAAGAWSPWIGGRLGLRIPVQPGKGYSVTVSQRAPGMRVPCILTEARVAVTPMRDSLRFGGTMELAGLDTAIQRRRVEALARAVPQYLSDVPLPQATETRKAWAGLRPCTPDGLPLLGRFRGWRNLVAATGHAMIGISLAPVTGKLVAEVIAGTSPAIDITSLDPDRFQ